MREFSKGGTDGSAGLKTVPLGAINIIATMAAVYHVREPASCQQAGLGSGLILGSEARKPSSAC